MRWFVALVIAGLGVASPSVCDALMPWNRPIRSGLTSEARLSADVDGDGDRDSILVQFFLKQDPRAVHDERIVVRIGTAELWLTGEAILPEVSIVDLDTSDVRRELMFAEEGPSDDPVTAFVAMHGDSLLILGEIPGDVSVRGDGVLSAVVRGAVLHTWWHQQWYCLRTATRIEPIEQALYPMRTRVTLRDSLTLVRSPSDPRVAFKLRAGAHAELLATDDKRWVLLRDASARIGWFEMDENRGVAEGHREGQEVFDGLLIVD